MHLGNIHSLSTGAGRVYAVLRSCGGEWISSWSLTTSAQVVAVSTRVSEVRHQLPKTETIEHSLRPTPKHQRGSWYRLVYEPEQMEFQLSEDL